MTCELLGLPRRKTIQGLAIKEDKLRVDFADGTSVTFWDSGQDCCEHRYMRSDDDLVEFVGAQFLGASIKQAPDVEDLDGFHEVQFLEIETSRGVVSISNHNEHNGYYGGFSLRWEET